MAGTGQIGRATTAGQGGAPSASTTAAPGSGGVLRAWLGGAAGAGRSGTAPLPAPPPPSLERAAANAAARAANRIHGLQATAEAVTAGGITLAELPELLPEGALLAIVDGPAERLGVIALCPAMVASLIEMQAMGRISARAVPVRRATRTDAAIAAEFVNLLVEELATALAGLPVGEALTGMRYASYLDEPRPLPLMLEDGGFHGLTLSLRLGSSGERHGTILLAIPGAALPVVGALPGPATDAGDAPASRSDPATRPTLAEAMRHAPVPLVAVLCRRTVTLRELRALQPGTVLALPKNALDEVTMETATGQALAQGRLGEADGAFAVRLKGEEAAPGLTVARAGSARGEAFVPGLEGLAPPAADHAEPPIADLDGPDLFRETAAAPLAEPASALPLALHGA